MYKVQLVDDEWMVRLSLRKLIEEADCGFEVSGEAKNGLQALEMIRESRPDILITDVHMPVMDGLELLEHVRREFPEMRSVVLSGYDEFAFAQTAMRLGVIDYMLKPITPEHVETLLLQLWNQLEHSKKALFEELEWNWYCKMKAQEMAERIWLLDEAKVKALIGEAVAFAMKPAEEEASEGKPADLNTPAKKLLVLVDALYRECRERLAEEETSHSLFSRSAWNQADPASRISEIEQLAADLLTYIRSRRNWGRRRQIEQVAAYIESHYADAELSLTEASERVGLSSSRVSTLFKEEMGEPFIQYLTRIRMEKAKQLLADPAIKTYEVSEQVGYPNYSHFNKAFRKHLGISPTEFKKRMGYY